MAKKKLKNNEIGSLLAICGALGAGGFYVPFKLAVESVPPEQFVLSVCLTAIGFNALMILVQRQPLKANNITILAALAFAILTNLGNYFVGKGMVQLSPAAVSVLARSQVLYVMIAGAAIFAEKLPRVAWLSALVASAGVAFMAEGLPAWDHKGMPWEYVAYGLLAAISFGTTHLIAKAIIHRINPVTYNLFRIFMAAGLMLLIPGNLKAIFDQSSTIWYLAGLSGFFGPFVSRLCQTYAVAYLPVGKVVLFSFLSPIFAGIATLVFLGEAPSLAEVLGGCLVLFGLSFPAIFALLKEVLLPRSFSSSS